MKPSNSVNKNTGARLNWQLAAVWLTVIESVEGTYYKGSPDCLACWRQKVSAIDFLNDVSP